MHDLKAIDTRSVRTRSIIAVGMLAAMVFAWFSIRWQAGNMLATLTPSTDPNLAGISEIAERWAPADPAAFSLKAAAGEDTQTIIADYEEAVRRAPNDQRWRIELGRAYEQDEQFQKAEAQLRKAVDLAPSYSSARWYLGNFYLRQQETDKAIAELTIAAQNDQVFREQVFSLVWDFSNKDASQLEKLAGDRSDMIARLAYFFAARGRAEDSLRNWNFLSDADKSKNAAVARSIALGLFDQKHFPESLEFARQYGAEVEALPETIANGSFEKPLGENEESRFGWSISRNDPRFEAIPDGKVKREGNRSLRVTFKAFNKPTLSNVLQTVVVEPNRKYRLQFWVRTENLRSSGMPMIEVVNANDEKAIVRSQKFSVGTTDWQQIVVDFSTPANCNGITLRTIREFCGDDCPITGIFWYDDFTLVKP